VACGCDSGDVAGNGARSNADAKAETAGRQQARNYDEDYSEDCDHRENRGRGQIDYRFTTHHNYLDGTFHLEIHLSQIWIYTENCPQYKNHFQVEILCRADSYGSYQDGF